MRSTRSFRARAAVVGVAASLATLLAVSTFASGAGGAPKQATASSFLPQLKVTCALNLVAVLPPRTTNAENFGTVDCDRIFGKGVQHDQSVVSGNPGSQLAGSFTGPYEQFFDNGKLTGHFSIDYTVNPAQNFAITYVGTIQVEGGTGLYRNVRGSGTLNGGSADAVHSTLTEVLTLTRLF
jgi:hypothetical protein